MTLRPARHSFAPLRPASRSLATFLLALSALALPFDLRAQRNPVGATPGSPAAIADSMVIRGDTTGALSLLNATVKANFKDAAAWYLLGLIHWERIKEVRGNAFIKDKNQIKTVAAADSSLRIATQLAPDSARYWLSLSKFNIGSGYSTVLFASQGNARDAFKAAEATGDHLLLAEAADLQGMATWRRYEASANRGLTEDGQRIQLAMNNNWPRDKALDYVKSFVKKIEPPTGLSDFKGALEKFQVAVDRDSSNQRYSRHLFMALAERKQWEEMEAVAIRRSRQFPLDWQSRLALGLARHRQQKFADARVAFDSALAMMDEGEREYLTRFTRILRPAPSKDPQLAGGDAQSFKALPEGQRRGLEEMYWYMNDPLTLTNENELRLEFLARVVYAEFRWTDDDRRMRGAESDRGDIHIRYGPADYEVSVQGNANFQAATLTSGATVVWAYKIGLTFFFQLQPGFASTRLALNDQDNVEKMKQAVPVSWANLPSAAMIDTIPMRIARFRARGDSSDAVIATRMPVDSMLRGLDVDRAPVDFDFRVFDQFVRVQGVESDQQSFRPDSAVGRPAREWTRRLGPGINVVRIEAMQADSRRAARAMARLMPTEGSGFGMSDILLGSKPSPRNAATAPRTWRDVEITPSIGEFALGSSLGLLWEVYEAGMKDGNAKYRVSITVERTDRSGVSGFTLRVLEGLGRTVTRTQAGRDKFTITFDRTSAAAGTLVEYLSLDLASSPAGGYTLRIDVQDLNTQKRTSRTTEFRIR
ncbi:MAG: GWxTD domain-containing protein [Gemmatimonadaceae bacterium]|nr:GWxTD domain-containing protein [Gemmatimonadaceae bacterium]